MHKKYTAKNDTYITNKILSNNKKAIQSNVGKASSLDLYKLYNENDYAGEENPIELTRLLLKFDTPAISASLNEINFNDPSFKVELELKDLQGSQIAPTDYTVSIYPLSKSFDEGVGRDITMLSHLDSANWLTASYSNGTYSLWNTAGASKEGLLGSDDIDIISSGNLGSGIEKIFVDKSISARNSDLLVDVTKIFSASATGILPDYGFLIKFSGSFETDQKSYFVKRFASAQSANSFKKPTLHVKYNDHIVDDRMFATYNTDGKLYLKNKVNGNSKNLLSGSSTIDGANCLLIKLDHQTNNITYLTASQAINASKKIVGLYSASFNIDGLNQYLSESYAANKNVTIHEKWTSLDENVLFYTGSFDLKKSSSGFTSPGQNKQVILYNLKEKYKLNEHAKINIFIKQFLKDLPAVRTPVVAKTDFEKYVYYQIKSVKENSVIIPFSDYTRCDVDSSTVSFDLPTHSLPKGHSYSIDIKIVTDGNENIYETTNTFKID